MLESGILVARASLISIVEDDDSVRQAMAALLEALDQECRCFESASDFLKDFEPGVYACVLSDIRMPGIDGLELQRRLKALDPGLPIIFMTSLEDEIVRQRALSEGAVDLLYKPVRTDRLVELFETAMRCAG